MKTEKLLVLQWKQFSRSTSFGKGIATKIFLGLIALYFVISFLFLGGGIYFVLEKEITNKNPFQEINSFMLFVFIGDLTFRYLMQKLPIVNIKPLLLLNVRKQKIINFVLSKSVFSFFNIIWLFFFIPFSVVLILEGYETSGVLTWSLAMLLVILCSNFLNFIINKSNAVLIGLALLVLSSIMLHYFDIYNFTKVSEIVFYSFYKNPVLIVIPLFLLGITYFLSFKNIKALAYLDGIINVKVAQVKSVNLSFIDSLGHLAPLIKNEIRLIWRNKRPKTQLFATCIFLSYGVFVFKETIPEWMIIFGGIMVTGGLILNYGQFVPAWDCAYYKMLMTQKFNYRRYLESKWIFFAIVTFFTYLLSVPYVFMGIDKLAIVTTGMLFNIGWNIHFILFLGAHNRKYIDISATGFANYQGTSAVQFMIIIPVMILPISLFSALQLYLEFYPSLLGVSIVGVLGIVFKKNIMNVIERRYLKNKYKTVQAFNNK